MKQIKGQIQIGLGVLAAGAFIIGSLTLALNSYLKSGETSEKVSAIEGDIKEIRNDIKWIKESFDTWNKIQIQENKLNKDGTLNKK